MRKIKSILFILFSIFILFFVIYNLTSIQIKIPKIDDSLEANFTFENNFGKLFFKNYTFNFTSNLIKFNSLVQIELYNVNIKNKIIDLTTKKAFINNKTSIIFENLSSKIKLK